jgi:hypothetical protein
MLAGSICHSLAAGHGMWLKWRIVAEGSCFRIRPAARYR